MKTRYRHGKACDPGTLSDDYKGLLTLFGERARRATIKVPLGLCRPRARATSKSPCSRWRRGIRSDAVAPSSSTRAGRERMVLLYGLLFGYLWGEANPVTNSESGKLFREIAQYYDLVGFSPRWNRFQHGIALYVSRKN